MKIVYHFPFLDTVNAHRTIYFGFKNAFEDMGHDFKTYTAGMDLDAFLTKEQPDIFITASHFLWRKQLDYAVLRKYRDKGMVVVTKVDFWQSPMNKGRINEAKSMKDDHEAVTLLKTGKLGDLYYHVVEQDDPRMEGFSKIAKKGYFTLPLAADKTVMNHNFSTKFAADISFIGTNLPQKREYFKNWLMPLGKKYDLKLYGQDWTPINRGLGYAQKAGQLFNIPGLKGLRKPKLTIHDEATIYSSTKVCVNLHEDYQRYFGGDCNERTFKIPACKAFEISDDVACIRKYFREGKEIVIATDKNDWFDKINYYFNHDKERNQIIKAGFRRVMQDHTYHNRVDDILHQYAVYIKSR